MNVTADPSRWHGMHNPGHRALLARGAPPPPLPLEHEEALKVALALRATGISYGAIAVVMGRYHGVWGTDITWRNRIRAAGAPPRHGAGGNRPGQPHAIRAAMTSQPTIHAVT